MRWCAQHWGQLRLAIDARGLSHLVDANADVTRKRIERSIRRSEPFEFQCDPLTMAFFTLNEAALERAGPRVLGKCPFCLLATEGHARLAHVWIDECCDMQEWLAHRAGLTTVQ